MAFTLVHQLAFLLTAISLWGSAFATPINGNTLDNSAEIIQGPIYVTDSGSNVSKTAVYYADGAAYIGLPTKKTNVTFQLGCYTAAAESLVLCGNHTAGRNVWSAGSFRFTIPLLQSNTTAFQQLLLPSIEEPGTKNPLQYEFGYTESKEVGRRPSYSDPVQLAWWALQTADGLQLGWWPQAPSSPPGGKKVRLISEDGVCYSCLPAA